MLRIPPILYGTAWKKERTAGLVERAVAAGFRGFDTAAQPKHYDEAGVGAGVAAGMRGGLAREDLYLQTKFMPLGGQDPRRVPYDAGAPLATQVRQSLEVSLRNLATAYVDCWLLHSPLGSLRETAAGWRALEAAADGRARALGISNCYDLDLLEGLHATARMKPAVVQNRFYAQTGYDREIRAFCLDHDIVYQSFWTLTANPHLLAHAVILDLCRKHARTSAQILFRYLTLEGVVPLTGTTSEAHMREDLAIFEFTLTASERAAITALLGG